MTSTDGPGGRPESPAAAIAAPRVLLIEDAEARAASLGSRLMKAGFSVRGATPAARAELVDRSSDIALLDWGMPEQDSIELLLWLRARGVVQTILVLTALDTVGARVRVLEAGADDCLVTPFAFEELVARMRALLRRTTAPPAAPLRVEQLQLLTDRPEILVQGRRVRLSPKERALLEHLLRRRGDIVTRSELLNDVFNYGSDPGTNLVDVHMAHLRRKIVGSGVVIETRRGIGFRVAAALAAGS
jgi:DNA-binding response OmpR family regulator